MIKRMHPNRDASSFRTFTGTLLCVWVAAYALSSFSWTSEGTSSYPEKLIEKELRPPVIELSEVEYEDISREALLALEFLDAVLSGSHAHDHGAASLKIAHHIAHGVARGEHLHVGRSARESFGLACLNACEEGVASLPDGRKFRWSPPGASCRRQIITLTSRAYEPVSGSLLDAVHQAFHNRRNEARVDPRRLRYSCTQPVFPPHSRGISCLSRTC